MRLPLSIFLFLLGCLPSVASSSFLKNVGQVHNQQGKPNAEVLYTLDNDNLRILIYRDGFAYQVLEDLGEGARQEGESFSSLAHRMEMRFVGMNALMWLEELEPTSTVYRFYTTGVTDEKGVLAPAFQQLVMHEVFEGVDVVFYANSKGKFEYDFVLRPGSDLGKVKMRVLGAEHWTDAEGLHHLQSGKVEVVQRIPACYTAQSKTAIPVVFSIHENELGFSSSQFPTHETVILDPTPELVYASYFGGQGQEFCSDFEVGIDGSIYAIGTTRSEGLATDGAFNDTIYGPLDCYFVKFSPEHEILYVTYFGGEGLETLGDLDLTSEALFVCGNTTSRFNISTSGSFQEELSQDDPFRSEAFFMSLTLDGERNWCTYFGGNQVDSFREILISSSGSIYVLGWSQSTDIPVTVDAYQLENMGSYDALVTEWTAEGQLVYASYFGGEDRDQVMAGYIDSANTIYMGGYTNSSSGLAYGSFEDNFYHGNTDGWIGKWQNGGLSWSRYIGAGGEDYVSEIEAQNGSVWLSGVSRGDLSFISANALYPSYTANFCNVDYGNMYLVNMNENGDIGYATYFGEGAPRSLKTGNDNSYLLTGYTLLSNFFGTSDSWQPEIHNQPNPNVASYNSNMFMSYFNYDGSLIWSTYFGDYSGTSGSAAFANGKLYAMGTNTCSVNPETDLQAPIVTSDALDNTCDGSSDAFLAIFDFAVDVWNKPLQSDELRVYPNPSNDAMAIAYPNRPISSIALMNSLGQVVFQQNRVNAMQYQLDLSRFAPGVYSLSCEVGGSAVTKLVVKN